jgi:hypothetical protein
VAQPSVASSGRTEAVRRACRWRRFGCTGLGWCCIGATHSKHGSFGYLKRSTKEVQKKYKRSTKEVQKKGHKNEHEETQNPKEPKEPSFVPFTVGKMPWFFTFKIVKSYMSSWFNLCNSFSIAVVVVLALFLSVPMLIPW